jgi:uncharacterized protein YdeI (YjbR/CyaY-like superfamily)
VEAPRGDAGLSEPIFFASAQEFYAWLEEHHDTEEEVYVGYYKTHTGKRGMSWSEAVDQALCFGWIDGRVNSIDADRYMQRFTPRRPGSNWSEVNVAKVAKLEEAGLLQPAGRAAFESRGDGHAAEAPDGLPPDYEQRLQANPPAASYFDAKPAWYRRTAGRWVMSAKREETRERRLRQLIEDSANGLDIKPLRRR